MKAASGIVITFFNAIINTYTGYILIFCIKFTILTVLEIIESVVLNKSITWGFGAVTITISYLSDLLIFWSPWTLYSI